MANQTNQSLIHSNSYESSNLFLEQKVKSLRDTDFALDTNIPLALRQEDCTLVLFYNDLNQEDRDLVQVWVSAARRTSGVMFAGVNLRTELSVNKTINEAKRDSNNPLYDFISKDTPIIIVYRNQLPQAVYNGPHEVQALIDYSLTLACQSSYYEREPRLGVNTFNMHISDIRSAPQFNNSPQSRLGLRQYGMEAQSKSTVTDISKEITE